MTETKNGNGLVNPRSTHPCEEVENLDRQIADLQAKRDAIAQLHDAALRLVSLGYTRRQVRRMAGFEIE